MKKNYLSLFFVLVLFTICTSINAAELTGLPVPEGNKSNDITSAIFYKNEIIASVKKYDKEFKYPLGRSVIYKITTDNKIKPISEVDGRVKEILVNGSSLFIVTSIFDDFDNEIHSLLTIPSLDSENSVASELKNINLNYNLKFGFDLFLQSNNLIINRRPSIFISDLIRIKDFTSPNPQKEVVFKDDKRKVFEKIIFPNNDDLILLFSNSKPMNKNKRLGLNVTDYIVTIDQENKKNTIIKSNEYFHLGKFAIATPPSIIRDVVSDSTTIENDLYTINVNKDFVETISQSGNDRLEEGYKKVPSPVSIFKFLNGQLLEIFNTAKYAKFISVTQDSIYLLLYTPPFYQQEIVKLSKTNGKNLETLFTFNNNDLIISNVKHSADMQKFIVEDGTNYWLIEL